MNNKYIVFTDQVGRLILGEPVGGDAMNLEIKNPAIIHIQPKENVGFHTQIIPYYFRELQEMETRNSGMVWTFPLAAIVRSNVVPDPQLLLRYEQLFAPVAKATKDPVPANPKVINLFDESPSPLTGDK